jgi:hypothetical protein
MKRSKFRSPGTIADGLLERFGIDGFVLKDGNSKRKKELLHLIIGRLLEPDTKHAG